MTSPLFEVHALNDEGIAKAQRIAASFSTLLRILEFECSPQEKSREFSIVKTKLEEASFFAKKAMASAPENQK